MASLVSRVRKLFSKSLKAPMEDPAAPLDAFPQEIPGSTEIDDSSDLNQTANHSGPGEPPLNLEEPPVFSPPSAALLEKGFSQGSTPIVGDQDLPTLPDDSHSIPGLYETWVGLEQMVTQAQNDLLAILTTREEAAILRSRTQERLRESEAIRAEAERISENTLAGFDRGFAVGARELSNRWATVREIYEAMKNYTALQRTTLAEVWLESNRSRQRATTELLKTLASVSTAMAQAQRELKEAADLPSAADSLIQSAQEELRCARAIRNELLQLGQDALDELEAAPATRQAYVHEITLTDPQDFLSSGRTDAGLLGTAFPGSPEGPGGSSAGAPQESGFNSSGLSDAQLGEEAIQSTEQVPEPMVSPEPEIPDLNAAAETSAAIPPGVAPPVQSSPIRVMSAAEVLEEEIAAATPVSESPGSAVAALAEELSRGLAEFGTFPEGKEQQERGVIEAVPQPVPEVTAPQMDPPHMVIEKPESTQPTHAELLRQELESATAPTIQTLETAPPPPAAPGSVGAELPEAPPPTAAELLLQEMEGATMSPERPDIAVPPAVLGQPPQDPAPPAAPELPGNNPTAVDVAPTDSQPSTPEPVPAFAPANSYTGRIYLMFPSSLSQGRLESVWDVLDKAMVGGGNITDTRLISTEAGIQFTLDLGSQELDIEALRNGFPDAEVVALEEDRLRINWSSD